MKIPTLKKMRNAGDVLIERALPKEGSLVVKIGDKVEPFAKLGMSKASYGRMPMGNAVAIAKDKKLNDYFYCGDLIGNVLGKRITAPFDGYLVKEGEEYVFKQEERDYWLLSGVWGEVTGLVENKSVLIRTQTKNIHLPVCAGGNCSGELVVFPNPPTLLEISYLEKYAKETFGKVIYGGNFIRMEFLQRAIELNVAGVIGGSAGRSAFSLAKKEGMFLGVFSGFGRIPTPKYIFNFLKEISSRYVFLRGGENLLRVPIPYGEFVSGKTPEEFLVELTPGLRVQVFKAPYFGFGGVVEDVRGMNVYVKLDEINQSIEVEVPGVFAVD